MARKEVAGKKKKFLDEKYGRGCGRSGGGTVGRDEEKKGKWRVG
jgi:hypothetical protein